MKTKRWFSSFNYKLSSLIFIMPEKNNHSFGTALARFGTANHGPQGVRMGFRGNRAKNPDTHFSFGTIMQST